MGHERRHTGTGAMSRFVLTLLFLAAAGSAMAQERLELARYSIEVPAGWSSQVNGEQWVIHPAAGANDCGIAPLPGMELGAGLTRAEARRQMWAKAVNGRRVLQTSPTESSTDPSGRTWTVDSAAIEEGGGAFVLALAVVELNGRAEGFLIVSTAQGVERYQSSIDAMFNSVRPRTSAAANLAAREKAPLSGQPSPLGSPAPGRLAGVYTATTHELRYGLGGLANQAVVTELVLFADGAALFGMPPEGLLSFDRKASRARWPDHWGTYTLRNKRLTITRAGTEQQYAVLPTGALENRYVEGGQERTGARYLPRPSLDGVRLDGEVRRRDHWPAPGNTSGIGTLPGCTFEADGTFRDEKLMWIVLPEREGMSKQAHEARVAPGRGRYRLEHWTLVLEYDDGRVNQVSFVATDRERPTRGAILNGYPIEPRP
jgi:hypothetical protein